LPDESPVTVAVTPTVPVAITELVPAETVTLITGGGGVIIGEPPPQPLMTIAKANATSVYAKETVRSICPPCIGYETDTVERIAGSSRLSKKTR
jgi:hypothetical protein